MIKFKKKNLSGSSKRWLQRHHNDSLVIKSKKLGFRSRAIFKLEEIDKKIKFLNKNDYIVDLGSSPGSWSQYLIKKGFKNIVSVDIVKMDHIKDVNFILGDFTDIEIQRQILEKFKNINTILSDIAANTTGNKKMDSFKTNTICIEVLKFGDKVLNSGGNILCKYFNGELDQDIIKLSKNNFKINKVIKPKTSRKDSKEMYIYCQK